MLQTAYDNGLLLSDEFRPEEHDEYFLAMAKFVCDGLDACGYEVLFAFPVPESAWNAYYALCAASMLDPMMEPRIHVEADELEVVVEVLPLRLPQLGVLVALADAAGEFELLFLGQQAMPADGLQVVLQAGILATVTAQFDFVQPGSS